MYRKNFFKNKKILAIILSIIIILSLILILPPFLFQPVIKEVKVTSVKGNTNNLVLDLLLTLVNNMFQSVIIENGKFNIIYNGEKIADIEINKQIELQQGTNLIPLQAIVTKDYYNIFAKALSELFSRGNITVNYEGTANIKYLLLSISTNLKGSTTISQFSLNDMIESISISYDKIFVKIFNKLYSDFIIEDINGQVKSSKKEVLRFNSTSSYKLIPNSYNLIQLNYYSTFDISSILSDAISYGLSLEISVNFKITFGAVSLPLAINLSKSDSISIKPSFRISSISYHKYPERLEILGYLIAEFSSIKIEGLNLEPAEGDVIFDGINVANFRTVGSFPVKGISFTKVLVFPIVENFYKLVSEFMKNSTLNLSLKISSPISMNFNGNKVKLNINQAFVSLDWGTARFVLDIKPYSISYNQNSNSLDIGFNFVFLSVNITSLPIIIDEAIFKLSFNNGTLILNQTIKGPVDLSNSTYFYSEVSLNLNDPKVKPLIQDFASHGSMILNVEGGWLKVRVYNKSFEHYSNVKFLIRISPLDILDAKAYLDNITQQDNAFNLKLSVSLKSKLKVTNLFLKSLIMTVLTLEGNKVLENFRQDVNDFLTGDRSFNFTAQSTVSLSRELTAKLIKDFFEKGKTNLIVLNANVSTQIGALDVNLIIKNVTLEVILSPMLEVFLHDIQILNKNEVKVSFDLKLTGINIPASINTLSGILTDENSTIIGLIDFKNMNYTNGNFKGQGIVKLLNKDQSTLAKLFLGYNATVMGRNLTGSIMIGAVNYDVMAERSLLIKIVPSLPKTEFELNVESLGFDENGNIKVNFDLRVIKTPFEFQPVRANFTVYDELGIEIAKGMAENFISKDKDYYAGIATLQPKQGSRLDYVASLIANGEKVSIYVSDLLVEIKIIDQIYIAKLPLNIKIDYKSESIKINIIEFHITNLSSNEINAKVSINITNPYNFPVNIHLAVLNIYDSYDNKPIGTAQIANLTLPPNTTLAIRDIEVNIPAVSVAYVLRHYNDQTGMLNMYVNVQVISSLSAYGIKVVIQYEAYNIAVKYP